jgi:hypothetical protein
MDKFTIYSNGRIIRPVVTKFPGGEMNVRVLDKVDTDVRIDAFLSSSDDIMTLVLR